MGTVNEIAYVEPMIMMLDEAIVTIPAGTIAVIPHRDDWEDQSIEVDEETEEFHDPRLPKWTLLMQGQRLKRELCPELSRQYPNEGFYDFNVPDLMKKFVLGVDEEGEIIWGDGVVYYQDVPKKEAVISDIRQTM